MFGLQWKGLVEVGILESILQLQSEIRGSLYKNKKNNFKTKNKKQKTKNKKNGK
jgi:hypothetical protein